MEFFNSSNVDENERQYVNKILFQGTKQALLRYDFCRGVVQWPSKNVRTKELQRRIDKGEFGGPKNGGDGFSGHGGYGSSAERGGALHG